MTSEELERAAEQEYRRLPEGQHKRLMSLHLTGDLGIGRRAVAVAALIAGGLVEEGRSEMTGRPRLLLTRAGRAYCRYHGMKGHAA